MIIGIVGFQGSGKDTIADYLQNIHQYRRESFANTLKDAVSAIFGWDRELLEGRTKESRAWRETVDSWWANRLNIPHLTPRWVLQWWGTEVVRKSFHDDTWIASLENKLRNMKDDIVITDCRFPNEIRAIKAAGGIVIRVKRGEDPEWYSIAKIANRGGAIAQDLLKGFNIHPSETAWIGTKFDAEIDNSEEGLDHLFSQVKHLVTNLPASTQPQSSEPLLHS